jgi:hypothetical protein
MEMPLTLKEFKDAIEYIQREDECGNRLSEVIREYRDILGDAEAPIFQGGTIVVNLLEKLWKLEIDDYGYTDISYWCWEKEYGEKWKEGDLVLSEVPVDHKYHKPILKTVEELYDYLCWCYETDRGRKERNPY